MPTWCTNPWDSFVPLLSPSFRLFVLSCSGPSRVLAHSSNSHHSLSSVIDLHYAYRRYPLQSPYAKNSPSNPPLFTARSFLYYSSRLLYHLTRLQLLHFNTILHPLPFSPRIHPIRHCIYLLRIVSIVLLFHHSLVSSMLQHSHPSLCRLAAIIQFPHHRYPREPDIRRHITAGIRAFHVCRLTPPILLFSYITRWCK